jgi:N-acyl-D-aspartate/D-glutamate deacylase
MPMTKEQVRDAWNSMSEQDKRESRLLGIVRMAYEDACAGAPDKDGKVTAIIDMEEACRIFRRSTGFWMGMSSQFDDRMMVVAYVMEEIVPALIADVLNFREVMRHTKLPDNVEIIEERNFPNSKRPN